MEDVRILVVDDDVDVARAAAESLRDLGMHCEVAHSGTAALAAFRQLRYDVVVTDVNMDGIDGAELFTRLRKLQPDLPVVFLTGEGSIPAAVEALKRGASQYLTKPCDAPTLRRAIEQALASTVRIRIEGPRSLPSDTEELLGRSAMMEELRARIALVARASSPVLVQGETGTGKDLVARAVHACSPRRAQPFVVVNAASMPESLLESEMFGHVRGAFTGATHGHRGLFAEADGGTLFLDEIGDMPLSLQPKLLRVLQTGQSRAVGAAREQHVDVRVVAATHRRLTELVREGRFREDLYYRINVVTLEVPPLRAHLEDVPELAAWFFLRALARVPGTPAQSMSNELIERLCVVPWPGNVRELASVVERMVVLARRTQLSPEDLVRAGADVEAIVPMAPPLPTAAEDATIDRVIQAHVEAVIERAGGNKAQAAKVLGVDLSTIYRWQRKWTRHT